PGCSGWGGCRWCPAGVEAGAVAGPSSSGGDVLCLAGVDGLGRLGGCLRGSQPYRREDGAGGGDAGGGEQSGGEPVGEGCGVPGLVGTERGGNRCHGGEPEGGADLVVGVDDA